MKAVTLQYVEQLLDGSRRTGTVVVNIPNIYSGLAGIEEEARAQFWSRYSPGPGVSGVEFSVWGVVDAPPAPHSHDLTEFASYRPSLPELVLLPPPTVDVTVVEYTSVTESVTVTDGVNFISLMNTFERQIATKFSLPVEALADPNPPEVAAYLELLEIAAALDITTEEAAALRESALSAPAVRPLSLAGRLASDCGRFLLDLPSPALRIIDDLDS